MRRIVRLYLHATVTNPRADLPIWLRARQASRLAGISLTIGLLSAIFVNTDLPLPATFAVNPPTVPFVVYAPVSASMVIAWQMSIQYEPNESLSSRALNRIRAGMMLTATFLICGPILLAWWIGGSSWALIGARNFLLVIWGTVIANTVLGLRVGTIVATLLILFVPSFTRTDARGRSFWWALTEAPSTSLPTLAITLTIVIASLVVVLAGVDRRART